MGHSDHLASFESGATAPGDHPRWGGRVDMRYGAGAVRFAAGGAARCIAAGLSERCAAAGPVGVAPAALGLPLRAAPHPTPLGQPHGGVWVGGIARRGRPVGYHGVVSGCGRAGRDLVHRAEEAASGCPTAFALAAPPDPCGPLQMEGWPATHASLALSTLGTGAGVLLAACASADAAVGSTVVRTGMQVDCGPRAMLLATSPDAAHLLQR